MKTARRTRRTIRTAGLVTVAAATAFALTACQDDGDKDGASDSSSEASEGSEEKGSEGSEGKDSGSAGSSGGSDSEAGSGGSDSGSTGGGEEAEEGSGGSDAQTCAIGKVSVDFQQTGGSMPAILLKATNNGSGSCKLYGHPFVNYPDAQSPIKPSGDLPESVVTLKKGESAYSALSLEKGDGANVDRAKQLTVQLADGSMKAASGTAKLNSPGSGGLALSDDSSVSYWNSSVEGAMQ